ncbi:MAG: hypothetical protein H0X70_03230 [Segetibacter sp.]|nr:hypothetical protein [Segetibacter sp.]
MAIASKEVTTSLFKTSFFWHEKITDRNYLHTIYMGKSKFRGYAFLLTYLFINNAKNNIELMQHIITTHFIYIYKHYGNIQITWR